MVRKLVHDYDVSLDAVIDISKANTTEGKFA